MSSFFAEIAEKLAQLSGVATPEVSRDELNEFNVRDIQAVRVSEGGGGGSLPSGGSTGEVLTKESNADGDVGWEASGGSQTFEHVVLPIAFDTAGLVIPASGPAGILVTALAPGDIVLALNGTSFFVEIDTIWDGSSPTLSFVLEEDRGNLPGTAPTVEATDNLANPNNDVTPGSSGTLLELAEVDAFAVNAYCKIATGLYVYVDDAAGGDPGSMQGEGAVHLFIVRAP